MSFLKAKNYSIIGLRERLSKIKMYFFDKRYRNRKINDQEYDNIDIQLKSNPSNALLSALQEQKIKA